MPNRAELESLVVRVNYPRIDTAAFPATIAYPYWTSEVDASDSYNVWTVDFFNGNAGTYDRADTLYVRLVRSGQPFASSGTRPVLSVVALSNLTATGTTLNATSDVAATGYWLVVPSGSTAPTARQVVDGATYGSVSTLFGGSALMAAATAKAFGIIGLTTGTAYQAYFVAVDASLNVSAVSGPLAFTPLAAQPLTWGPNPPVLTYGGAAGTVSVSVVRPNSGNTVQLTASPTGNCTVGTPRRIQSCITSGVCTDTFSASLSPGDVGSCTVTADLPAGTGYAAALSSLDLNVGKGTSATLTTIATPASIVFNGTSTLSTSGGSGTGAVTYSVVTGGSRCSITGSTLTGTDAGTCTVTATQAADANYNAGSSASITVTVTAAPVRSYSANSPTGGGQVSVALSGTSSAACGFASTSYKTLPTGASASPPGFSLPNGVFAFSTNDQCAAASGAVTFTLTYPSAVPANAKLYKFGPTTSDPTAHWYTLPFTGAGSNTISFSITDGGLGDDDLSANGTIVDDVGVGVPVVVADVQNVPTLSEWALMLLVGLMGLMGLAEVRRGVLAIRKS